LLGEKTPGCLQHRKKKKFHLSLAKGETAGQKKKSDLDQKKTGKRIVLRDGKWRKKGFVKGRHIRDEAGSTWGGGGGGLPKEIRRGYLWKL